MTLLFHRYDHKIRLDLEGSAISQELGVQAFSGLPFIALEQEGHSSIEVVGCRCHGQVEVHLDDDGRGDSIEMKEMDLLEDPLIRL